MNISMIMSKKVVTVGPDDSLGMVKDIFDHARFHHLLVVEEDVLWGVISDRDLFRSISPNIGTNRYTPRDLETLNQRVHSVITVQGLSHGMGSSWSGAINVPKTCLALKRGHLQTEI
jgi:acetoin utilization protein AcuB